MNNDLTNELSFNFINYAAAVNTDRAIPDATSGLKPVARRILYGAYDGGRVSSKPHVKCARIVGDVMGSLHPHGDSSIYGALVRLAQDWVMRYPLIDFHGNVGNIGGDGPASSRYTEARLSKISEDGMLFGLKKNNVDFIPNYDESSEEPATLPAIFPNLLCNPNTGIGVAMACNWLPHNLNEVADAIYMVMDGKDPVLPGPDFPTGGLIINGNEIPSIMRTGHGSIKVRGKYKIENDKIIFYEIPYDTTIEDILKQIGEAADSKEIDGIDDIRDESTLKGLRIVIECKRNANKENIVQLLFAKTDLQTSISYNQVALVDKVPTELNLKDCIEIYINHNIGCLLKECNFDLKKANDRLHILEGLLIALEDIDNVIALIKSSSDSKAAESALCKKYNLSEVQAKSILAMRLSSLAKLEKIELENEKKELINEIEKLNNIISHKDVQIKCIRERLSNLVSKYGDKRRTEITNIEVSNNNDEVIKAEDVVVIISADNSIKRIPSNNFKIQKRNGKGVKTGDATVCVINTNTVDTLMMFSNYGKVYRYAVNNIPQSDGKSKVAISSLIKCEENEKIIAATAINIADLPKYVLFFTKNGIVKKTETAEYTKTNRAGGLQAIKLCENDDIVNVIFINDGDICIATKHGYILRTDSTSISSTGRATVGVKGIRLDANDYVISGFALDGNHVLLVTDEGCGHKVLSDEFPYQNRGGKGVKCANTTLAAALPVNKDDNLLICGTPNSICVSALEITQTSRIANGVSLIKNSKITSVSKI